jgi:hypothetical protein
MVTTSQVCCRLQSRCAGRRQQVDLRQQQLAAAAAAAAAAAHSQVRGSAVGSSTAHGGLQQQDGCSA